MEYPSFLAGYICKLCNKIARDVHQLKSCGCRFCFVCIQKILEIGEIDFKCPVDGSRFLKSDVVKDKGCDKELREMLLSCIHCKWIGSASNMNNHLEDFHESKKRPPFSTRATAGEFQKLDINKSQERQFGCNLSGTAGQELQLQRSSEQEAFGYCRNSRKIANQQMEIRDLKRKVEVMDTDFKDLTSKHNQLVHMIKGLVSDRSIPVPSSKKSASMECIKEKLFEKADEYVTDNTGGFTNKDVKVLSSSGAYWRIRGIRDAKIKLDKGSFFNMFSEPLYTSRSGYKCGFKIYPGGDGVGLNTHISAFFFLMKGEWDDYLKFPFCMQVEISIINHADSEGSVKGFIIPDGSANFQKCVTSNNRGIGLPLLAKKELLESSDFIRNDTMTIKIVMREMK